MRFTSYLAVVSAALLATGCSTSKRVPPTATTPHPEEPKPAPVARRDSWKPRMTAESRRYLIQDSATVALASDSSQIEQPITSTAVYLLSFSPLAGSFKLTATVDSSTIGGRPRSSRATPAGQQHFSAIVSPHGTLSSLTSTQASTCVTGIGPAASRLEDLIPALPAKEISTGEQWTDTTSRISCHGKVSLSQQSIRHYKLLELTTLNQRSAAKIERTVVTTVSNPEGQALSHVSAQGSGSSTAILYVDRVTSALLMSDVNSKLSLVVTTTRGKFPFRQNVITHIEERR
jgi:hypothetical protein